MSSQCEKQANESASNEEEAKEFEKGLEEKADQSRQNQGKQAEREAALGGSSSRGEKTNETENRRPVTDNEQSKVSDMVTILKQSKSEFVAVGKFQKNKQREGDEKSSSNTSVKPVSDEVEQMDVDENVRREYLDEEREEQSQKSGRESLETTDSDIEQDKQYSPKTLEDLGIKLNQSERIWRGQKDLTARQLGFISPVLFTRNVSGSVNMVEKFKLEKKLESHNGCVNTLNFNSSGDLLASGSDDLDVVVWDWAKGKKVFRYESGHSGNVFQAKFMPNTGDSIIVTCARDGQVRVGYLSSLGGCQSNKRLAQHKAPAHKLSIQPGSPNIFLTCGEDGHVIQVDLRESSGYRKLLCRAENRKIPLYTIFINPAKQHEFAVGGRDHRCSSNAEHIHKYKGHRNSATVKGVNFYGPRSEFVVSGSDCGHVFLWDKTTESVVQLLEGDEAGVVNCLEPHPLYPVLATSGLDHDVKIWTPTSHEPTDLEKMKSIIIENDKERDEEMRRPHDPISEDLLWLMVNHITRRRFYPAESDSDDSNDDENDGSSEVHGERLQCYPS